MLRLAILEANQGAASDEAYINPVVSIVGLWLQYEIQRAGLTLVPPRAADVVLLVYAGAIDWTTFCRRALRRAQIPVDPAVRQQRPYVITGGAIDASPFEALATADALAVGEAYQFVRELLRLVKGGADLAAIRAFIIDYPHAIERQQLADLTFDPSRPWLLSAPAPMLATPDTVIDWDETPVVKSDDRVLRVLASKGCHLRCTFCATTFRQPYQVTPNTDRLIAVVQDAARTQRGASLITNDAAALPQFADIIQAGALSFQSMTVKALRQPDLLKAICASGARLLRFGVEGISERIRQAFGKPVSNAELVHIVGELNRHRINCHLFFIVGAPFETDDDFANLQQLVIDLSKTVRFGITRLKFTAFQSTPPAPLAHFSPASGYEARWRAFDQWQYNNWRSRHLMLIPPRLTKASIRYLRDAYRLPISVARAILASSVTVDFAPTYADAQRMLFEVIGWPLDTHRRWRLSRSYAHRMGVLAPVTDDAPGGGTK